MTRRCGELSKKSNVNTDHYKTAGRGRPGEGLVPEIHKRSFAQVRAGAAASGPSFLPGARGDSAGARRLEKIRLLGRLKRRARLRGLTARQLMERRMMERRLQAGRAKN